MDRNLGLYVAAAFSLPLLASCVTTLPVPRQIADELVGEDGRARVRPIIRLQLRREDGLPLRDARSYARRTRDDGQIYAVNHGRIQLGPQTIICHHSTEVDSSVPAHEHERLNDLGQRVLSGIDNLLVDEVYNARRGDFVFRVGRRIHNDMRCSTEPDALHIRSQASLGRASNSIVIEVMASQGEAFYMFFLERNLTDPPLETILTQVYGAEGPLFDVLGDDMTLLSLVVGYYTRALSE